MKCPQDQQELSEIKVTGVAVGRCGACGGLWFDNDELRQAKDYKEPLAQWFDFELWHNPSLFTAEERALQCPRDASRLYRLRYQNSDIEIDACKKCNGVWLNKDEFRKVINYVQEKSSVDILEHYLRTLIKEGKEIFTGPEDLRSEMGDFVTVLKLFQYKLVVQHPVLSDFFLHLPG